VKENYKSDEAINSSLRVLIALMVFFGGSVPFASAGDGQEGWVYVRCWRLKLILASIIVAPMILFSYHATAATLPPGFIETQVASNLSGFPTAMAFAPDGRLFVCLQDGRVRVIKNGSLLSVPFVSINVDFFGARGLLGIAFDPNFAANHYVYFYYTVPAPLHNRVSRFTVAGDIAAPGSETIILELNNLNPAISDGNGGALHFGPDGKLYIGVGEDLNGANAQTLSNLLGKMLRINADGSIPVDNPFYNTATGVNRAIWALGLRNPFTFAFQPGSSRMFINDVGGHVYEEIDDGIAGSNYGWPTTEGPTSNPAFRGPIYYYGHGTTSTTGCAVIGATFYNPSVLQFPLSYIGKYFFADFCNGWIRILDPTTHTASGFATGISNPVDLQVGPDGALYYLAHGFPGQVFRVSATHGLLGNISTRLHVGTGENVLIAGFIIGGTGSKQLVLRALGPTLTQFGVSGVLQNPTLGLYNSTGGVIAFNDNWAQAANAQMIPVNLRPPDNLESAILVSLNPGAYTAIVTGVNNTTGIALVEAYDIATGATAHLSNISSRGLVQTGTNVMIAGVIVQSGNENVLVRALGPTLAGFGISNPLANPTLELRDANGALIASNDNWKSTQQSEIMSTGKAPPNDLESAILRALAPGNYTAILRGVNNTTGVALLEVYALQ
jgi:glucose/arabinose dehydrogenase